MLIDTKCTKSSPICLEIPYCTFNFTSVLHSLRKNICVCKKLNCTESNFWNQLFVELNLRSTCVFLILFISSDSDRDKFRLLCTDGSQAPLSHYRNCNLGHGPGGGTVTRFNFRKVARRFLETLQVLFSPSFCFLSTQIWLSAATLDVHYRLLS